MNLEKIYYDINGKEVNILQLVKRHPEWAAERIQQMEKELEDWKKHWRILKESQ